MEKSFKYKAKNESPVYESVSKNNGVKIINRLLIRTYVGIGKEVSDFYKVVIDVPDGCMKSFPFS